MQNPRGSCHLPLLCTFVAVFLMTLSLLSCTALSQPIFPSEWSALAYQNDGGSVDSNSAKLAFMRISNSWKVKSERIEVQFFNEPLQIQLHNENTQFVFYPHNKTCIVNELGFPPLPPNWLANSIFEGFDVVNGVHCRKWKRLTSTYWESAESGEPIRVNESNFFVWNYVFGTFKAGPQDSSNFIVPSYCIKKK
ncbi:hypothetical protein FDP41_006120 [Naegleria fowleri]|uniref:Uncharacterized protein n=1 Tax=Naegleria fowleri TaxID=5763 RepID=A0A6A5BIL5_NAEFO|nr:uncharacterized protein FDP41_006120 [Naegleria fowleri]KAF0974646.1 hypothetical protein FDP41_006120 [Naegleria fowleri]CAG4711314.1 unnamed protein product [Naegleria fowleri]